MKINNLTPFAGALDGSEPLPTVKAGSKRITSAQIAALGSAVGIEGAAVLAAIYDALIAADGSEKVSYTGDHPDAQTRSVFEKLAAHGLDLNDFTGTPQQKFERAMAEAGASVGGAQGNRINVNRGIVPLTQLINIANRASVRGANKRGSILQAQAGFAPGYMFTADNGVSSMFDNAFTDLTIDCNDIAGLGGILSDAWQEGGGLERVLIHKFRTKGVRFQMMEGGAALCRFNGVEMFGSALGAETCIEMDDPSLENVFRLSISDSTFAGGGADNASMPNAINVVRGSLSARETHFENCESGITLAGSGNHIIELCTGASSAGGVDQLVRIAPTFTGGLRMRGCKRNGATLLLKDERPGGYGDVAVDVPEIIINPRPPLFTGAAHAMVIFDGTGPTITKGRYVNSIDRIGPGVYIVNLTYPVPSADEILPVVSHNLARGSFAAHLVGVASIRVEIWNAAGDPADSNEVKVIVHKM